MADKSWLGQLKGSASEAKDRLSADAKERSAEAQRKGSIILSQKDVLTGHWDASKVLFTTIDGQLRPITSDDLAAFRRNIKTAQSRLTKGITAKQVIDWSLHDDRKRATEQIKMAVPASAHNGTVRFITNAGPESLVSRHHIIVEFLNYGAEAASGSIDPRKSAMRLRHGPLKFECDCERHRYWYRYIATIGGFNAGRSEVGFPKIRNPKLQGIACKHILRVMSDIQSGGAALGFLTKLMDKAKSSDVAKAALRHKQEAAEKIVQNQSRRSAAIKTSDQKRLEKEAAQLKKSAIEAMKKAQKPKKVKPVSTNTGDADKREAKLRATMAKFGIEPTQEQIDKVRSNAK
jgi:hypothetical protein